MKKNCCPFCFPDYDLKSRIIKLPNVKKYKTEPWVVVPNLVGTFGHLLVISRDHYTDISDPCLSGESGFLVLKDMMNLIIELSSKIKSYLTINGKCVEKIYVLTQCETPHLHFQLIPRFEGDSAGNHFLYEVELKECRWLLHDDTKEEKMQEGIYRIKKMRTVLNHHENLLNSSKWVQTNDDRINIIKNIQNEIEKIFHTPL